LSASDTAFGCLHTVSLCHALLKITSSPPVSLQALCVQDAEQLTMQHAEQLTIPQMLS